MNEENGRVSLVRQVNVGLDPTCYGRVIGLIRENKIAG
jgi:hypothetical protein